MKDLLNDLKYTIILILCQISGMLLVYYQADAVWFIVSGILLGVLGTLMKNKKI